jgi:hypothetical protein
MRLTIGANASKMSSIPRTCPARCRFPSCTLSSEASSSYPDRGLCGADYFESLLSSSTISMGLASSLLTFSLSAGEIMISSSLDFAA